MYVAAYSACVEATKDEVASSHVLNQGDWIWNYALCSLWSSEPNIVICKVLPLSASDHGRFADVVRQWKGRQWSSPVKCMGMDTKASGHRYHSIGLFICYRWSTTSWWTRAGLAMQNERMQRRELSEPRRWSRWIWLSMDALCVVPSLFGISSGWHTVYKRLVSRTSSVSRFSNLRYGQHETAMVVSRSRHGCS